jgi:chemotaxis protein methyltransferase CheR
MISDKYLLEVAQKIKEKYGISFAADKLSELKKILLDVARESEYGYEFLIEGIRTDALSKSVEHVLISKLSIGETYFFREPKALNIAIGNLLPEILRTKEKATIWSAACSGGEEPYSIAILIDEKLGSAFFPKIEIWGTDFNPVFIKKALKGEYRPWSFRNCPPACLDKYFEKVENEVFVLQKRITEKVKFKVLNLFDESFPSPFNKVGYFDIIFLRNVLIYFDEESIQKVIEKLFKLLAPEGYLITGVTEMSLISYKGFVPLSIEGMRIFKKTSKSSQNTFAEQKQKNKVSIVKKKRKVTSKSSKTKEIRYAKSKKTPHEISFHDALTLFDKGDYRTLLQQMHNELKHLENMRVVSKEVKEKFFLYCKALLNLGLWQEADDACSLLIKKIKTDEKLFYLLAVLSSEKEDYDKAIEYLNKTIFLKHDFPMAYFLKANSLLRLERIAEAKKEFKNLLKLLDNFDDNDILEESDGLTVGNLRELTKKIVR